MAALDFPDTPAVGELYGSSGTVWRWDGARWASTAGASGARGAVGRLTMPGAAVTVPANTTTIIVQPQPVNFVAGRLYKITYTSRAVSAAPAGFGYVWAQIAGTNLAEAVWGYQPGNNGNIHYEVLYAPTTSAARNVSISYTTLAWTATVYCDAPGMCLVEDITYEAGSSGTPTLAPSWATATIPGLNWFISGGAGTSSANPRALSMANFSASPESGITLTDSNTALTFATAGTYQLNSSVQVLGHWVAWVQVRHIRNSATINGATAQDARGVWGNPPGVNGFDTSYVKVFPGAALLGVLPGDKVQTVIWTSGGADATSVAGDNAGYSRLSVVRVSA